MGLSLCVHGLTSGVSSQMTGHSNQVLTTDFKNNIRRPHVGENTHAQVSNRTHGSEESRSALCASRCGDVEKDPDETSAIDI